jgi:hypothetical protein
MQKKLYLFSHEMQLVLRNFEEEWEYKNKSDPESYPMDLDDSLWDEMFLIYYTTGQI